MVKHTHNYYRSQAISLNSFGLSSVNTEKVFGLLKSIDKAKATGPDNIPARFVSDAAEYIAPCTGPFYYGNAKGNSAAQKG